MNRQHVILSTLCLSLLYGCATEPTRHHQHVNEAFKAESFSQSGQHKQAASEYQSLANIKPSRREHYSLLAAEAYVQSGDSIAAQSILNSINLQSLSAENRNKLNLILIQIDLSNGETEQALNRLKATQPYNLSTADQITFYQSLAFAHSLTGNLLQSAQARLQLSPLLPPSQRQENDTVILDTLSLLPSQTLSLQQPPAPDLLGGWMALANLLKHKKFNQSPGEFQSALLQWRRLFPQHPANTALIQSYTEGVKNTFKRPAALAILLPQSGPFAKAAEAIKAGFMAAFQQAELNFQPSIRFYDSSNINPVTLYHQAISEGAELVIGPLSKDNIQDLALGAELPVPVLALNHIPNLAKDNLFQFGLSPIDESKQLVNKAAIDGIKKILILTPQSNQGQRISDYIAEHWQQTGGSVLESQQYNHRETDFTKTIKELLNIDESQYRYKRLKQVLAKNIEYTERRRNDVDAIFLSASPQKGRSIYPQLQFHHATQVPVYALPQIHSGLTNPSADIDLNSITFCDIPWLFPNVYSGALSQESLRTSWQRLPSRYLRLIALGIDAFNIIPALEQINSTPYAGATGTLSINSKNKIIRELVCAKFAEGHPVLLNPLNVEPESEQTYEDFYQ